jgi:hypothetical protein
MGSIQEVIGAWEVDYKSMLEQMIYDENPPSFDEIIKELTNLKHRINALTWKFDKEFPLPNQK